MIITDNKICIQDIEVAVSLLAIFVIIAWELLF
jgi:hypothetical protein